jgi:hypothetical protein
MPAPTIHTSDSVSLVSFVDLGIFAVADHTDSSVAVATLKSLV